MMIYKVTLTSYSYTGMSTKEYLGTLPELSKALDSYLNYTRCRTASGLQRKLRDYSKKHNTSYTSTHFTVIEM